MFLSCFSGSFFFLSIFYFHSFWNPLHILYWSCSILIAAALLQSCPTLCDPMDCSLPGSSVHGIFQATVLEWGAIAFSSILILDYFLILCLCVCYFLGNFFNLMFQFFWNHFHLCCFLNFQCILFSSVAQSCPTLCDPMNRSTPSLPVHHQLPEFTQTHVHRVGDAIQPSHPLSSPSPPAPYPSQHQGLFQWVKSLHEVAKVLEFPLRHQSFQWTPRTNLL